MFDIQFELSKVPALPGIYIMKDKLGSIIYVGKAKVLKNRVRQYFQNQNSMQQKTRIMVSLITEIETIVTSTEVEALILERNLIKKYRPKYNVMLKDDKNYPLIKVTMAEEYPRLLMTRKVEADGSRYFGPFTSVFAVRETLEFISKIYPLKSCGKKLPKDLKKDRPCINYQIGRCLAPCQGDINSGAYRKMIKNVCTFLDGDTEGIIKQFRSEMGKCSDDLNFEKAKEYRDKIYSIERITDKQLVSLTKAENGDFIAYHGDEIRFCIQIFFLRGRNIIGRKSFFSENPLEKSAGEIISDFIIQYYDKKKVIPNRVYVQEISEEQANLEVFLSGIRNTSVKIIKPQKGEKKHIIDMAQNNARIEFEKSVNTQNEKDKYFETARKKLAQHLLIEIPVRIEAFDISNTSKDDVVAAMVVFDKNEFEKRSYRKYTIRGDSGKDDYSAMAEVIKRRFRHLLEKDTAEIDKTQILQSLKQIPDVIFVDGGIGHAHTVEKVLLDISDKINVIGMVKNDKHRTKGIVFKGDYFDLSSESTILNFVTSIQDETHRVASGFNRQKRKKRVIASQLDNITGIGEQKKKNLLQKFGSVKKIREASMEQLMQTDGINEKLAEKILKEISKD